MASQTNGHKSLAGRSPTRLHIPASSWYGFMLVTVQFGLLVLLFDRFELENEAVRSILRLSFAGFIVHHLLPLKFRQPFFLLLSFIGIAWILGMNATGWSPAAGLGRTAILLVIGSILIGICHLPLSYTTRTLLLLGSGVFLALLRTGIWIDFGRYSAIWPILGAMFMFRLIVYQYDLENMKQKPTLIRSMSYFFLLPNVCFPLFPVIDFKTFCRNYFSREATEIYDTGLRWMLRGIIHLLLWRLVYYHFFIDPSRVTDGRELVQFMVSNVLLYLRVSGEFHLVIGLLHMFGFSLPRTNRFYFLASSFTDYWRRINIYWKDFILKIIYNPIVFRLKKWGEAPSVIIATLFAFGLTWLLHSYQWFWLRGDFPVTENDLFFWGALGVLVIINSLRELKYGRKRTLGRRALSMREEFLLGAKTAATFGVLTVLWSIWNSQSMHHVIEMWKLADVDTLWISALVLSGIGIARIMLERWEFQTYLSRQGQTKLSQRNQSSVYNWQAAVITLILPALFLGVLSVRSLYPYLGGSANVILSSLSSNAPSQTDQQQMQAGYYENLMDVRRFDSLLSEAYMKRPADWQILEDTPAIRWVNDIHVKELVASSEHSINGKIIKINSDGMRDKAYTLIKPPESYRIALLGSSLVMGWGVNQNEDFATLLEQQFSDQGQDIQVLNFAINGYTPLSQLSIIKNRVMRFNPDVIFLVGHDEDIMFIQNHLAKAIRMGIEIDPFLSDIASRANIDANTPPMWAAHRLEPYWPELIKYSFKEIALQCVDADVDLVWVYLPGIFESSDESRQQKTQQFQLAQSSGFKLIDLSGLYDNYDPNTLAVAAWDAHPNAIAHKIIAEKLHSELMQNKEIWP